MTNPTPVDTTINTQLSSILEEFYYDLMDESAANTEDKPLTFSETKATKKAAQTLTHLIQESNTQLISKFLEIIKSGEIEYEKYGECPVGCGMMYGCRCDSASRHTISKQLENLEALEQSLKENM